MLSYTENKETPNKSHGPEVQQTANTLRDESIHLRECERLEQTAQKV